MAAEVFRYSVLVYEDRCGIWLKIPEVDDLQILTTDFETGLSLLEERLDYVLAEMEGRGELVPKQVARTIRRVDKLGYGPTEIDLGEQYRREEYAAGGD